MITQLVEGIHDERLAYGISGSNYSELFIKEWLLRVILCFLHLSLHFSSVDEQSDKCDLACVDGHWVTLTTFIFERNLENEVRLL